MKIATTGKGTFLRHPDGRVEYRPPLVRPDVSDWTRESWASIQELLREDGPVMATVSRPHDGTGSVEVEPLGMSDA